MVGSVVLLGVLVAFLVLLARTVVRGLRARRGGASVPPAQSPAPPAGESRPHRVLGGAAAGLAAVVLAVAVGGAVDVRSLPVLPGAASGAVDGPASRGVEATGETTTVEVAMRGMRFHPASVEVPAGNRLVIEVRNEGDDGHDLVLESGARTGLGSPPASGRHWTPESSAAIWRAGARWWGTGRWAWCSAYGSSAAAAAAPRPTRGIPQSPQSPGSTGSTENRAARTGSRPPRRSTPWPHPPPASPPATPCCRPLGGPGPRVHRRTLTVRETVREVAPGVRQTLWTFGGTAPGPVLRGRVGDTFEITLVNDGSIGHSIDFHAGALAPDKPMRTIAPGESLTYRFTAERSGVWMYHCSTMPMSLHIANGMYGAVVIDPPQLPDADREFLLIQSDLYLGGQGGTADAGKVAALRPDAVVFNGYANQYAYDP
ncbi:multicopper oxidase domain-containing protein [Streptomyces radiopugnans]|nr:multicopper oxidase domain-containing protein [Streptomyces radiopugnans]